MKTKHFPKQIVEYTFNTCVFTLQGAKLHACQGAAGITLPVHQRRRVLFVRAESSGNRANSVMALSRARAGAGAGAGAGVVGLPACLCSLHSEQAIVKDKGVIGAGGV